MYEAFLKEFASFSSAEQMILKLITIRYEGARLSHVATQLNQFNIRTERDHKFNSANIREYLIHLEELGWLEVEPGNTYAVPPKMRLALMRYISRLPGFDKLISAVQPSNSQWNGYSSYGTKEELLIEIRAAFFKNEEHRFNELMGIASRRFPNEMKESYFHTAVLGPFDPDWVRELPLPFQEISAKNELVRLLTEADSADDLLSFLAEHEQLTLVAGSYFRTNLYFLYYLRGELAKADTLIPFEKNNWRQKIMQSELAILRGQDQEGIALFEAGLQAYRKEVKSKNAHLLDFSYVLYLLALLRQEEGNYLQKIADYVRQSKSSFPTGIAAACMMAVLYLQNKDDSIGEYWRSYSRISDLFLDWLGLAYAAYWLDHTLLPTQIRKMEVQAEKLYEQDYRWPAMEFSFVLSRLHGLEDRREYWQKRAKKLQKLTGIKSFVDAVPRMEAWERALEVLSTLGQDKRPRQQKNVQKRLIWLIDIENEVLEPKLQQVNKNGQWSAGRRVALKRLKEGGVEDLQQPDLAVIKTIKETTDYFGWRYEKFWEIDFQEALVALIGHPHLYLLENPSVAIELAHQSPQLLIDEQEGIIVLKFNYDFEGAGIIAIKETPTRYIVLEVTEDHAQIKRQIGKELHVPARARKQLEGIIGGLSRVVPVQSELNGAMENIPVIQADPITYVHILPVGDSFKLEFFVKPFKTHPPYLKPGIGREKILADISGQQQVAQRRLDRETNNAQLVINACPTLQYLPSTKYEWVLENMEDCLNILLELQPLRTEGQIVVEHPRGEPVRLAGQVGFDDLSLQVKGERNWFEVTGELRINEHEVLNFRELLERTAASDSRFIQLSDGQFLALTERMRRKLRELDAVFSGKGKQMHLHPLATELLDDISDQLAEFKEDLAWQKTRQKLDAALRIRPQVPTTFRAELRPYQLDGFRWLMQLANWGVGACLADDMGLGKTIQALAVMVARAEQGPSLVVAPASVTRNWLRETQKFAPTLRPQLLGPGDRDQVIADLGPYDLLLVSYGLLPFEQEKLAAKNFSTIVLDEAQAIKNRSTKRSKAAKELQGDFRLITTGTPIENHLGELWNLYHFLNPGLLGTLEHFNNRFAGPITKNDDLERKQQLRRLIQPFILRRRKEDVLQELPPKTEVVLNVELSEEEQAFYEALRQKALQDIEASDGPQKRFQILAELTRLRQAACHPRLLRPDIDLASSKMALVGETIEELLENGHKALVFSQFVKHLRLLEEWVQDKGIAYQYLDGQTPGKKRDEAVQAFQRGEGQLFLISLKAGGTGLNLTAADYVLHLDPWWNPAVEDQASDRAHRIGQQRPVTVYRFVSENTIEEKIVQLHHDKRDLADSLLSGAEQSAKLSAEDLVELIKGG
ncbi:MAG: SWF/SNF family helicase [Saprospiraceae bacterium]|nr:MAG: SWF/SNF family helicase [Saprospiraceae bacterium]